MVRAPHRSLRRQGHCTWCEFLDFLFTAGGIGKAGVILLIKADSLACSQSAATSAVLHPKGSWHYKPVSKLLEPAGPHGVPCYSSEVHSWEQRFWPGLQMVQHELSSHWVTGALQIHPCAPAAPYCLWTENAGQVGFGMRSPLKGTDGAKELGNLLSLLVEAKFKSRWECVLWYLRLIATMDERLMLAM